MSIERLKQIYQTLNTLDNVHGNQSMIDALEREAEQLLTDMPIEEAFEVISSVFAERIGPSGPIAPIMFDPLPARPRESLTEAQQEYLGLCEAWLNLIVEGNFCDTPRSVLMQQRIFNLHGNFNEEEMVELAHHVDVINQPLYDHMNSQYSFTLKDIENPPQDY